ncbi:MAG TPA: hypothetical protein VFA69_09975 [Candidatus Nitrosotalea sp.]|nr:hypothetical protein [Candidatus Nitrosotalea sp.]
MQLVRNEFEEGEPVTLNQLYEILSKNPEVKIRPDVLGHRIRSAIYALHKSNKIMRVSDSTYKKVNNK